MQAGHFGAEIGVNGIVEETFSNFTKQSIKQFFKIKTVLEKSSRFLNERTQLFLVSLVSPLDLLIPNLLFFVFFRKPELADN